MFIKIDREKLVGDVLDKRKPYKTIKTSVYEKRKIRIFPNGLVHGFWSKIGNFVNVFLDNINMDFKRRQNWHFCKGDSP